MQMKRGIPIKRPGRSGHDWQWTYAVRAAIGALVLTAAIAFVFGFIAGAGYRDGRQLLRQAGWSHQ